MTVRLVAALGTVACAGTLFAQAAPPAARDAASVDSYLCTFAGKCGGGDAAAEPSMAAPATKGFRLAAPSAAPGGGAVPSTTAPNGARAASAAVASARPAMRVRPAAVRTVARPAAGTRADLMLTFGYNSDQLTDAAKERARVFATALQAPELKAKRFLIEGHTDSRGSRAGNLDLSRRRAQSVADYLVAQGVEQGRVEVKGYGPDRPLPHHSPAAEANRRVEAVLLS